MAGIQNYLNKLPNACEALIKAKLKNKALSKAPEFAKEIVMNSADVYIKKIADNTKNINLSNNIIKEAAKLEEIKALSVHSVSLTLKTLNIQRQNKNLTSRTLSFLIQKLKNDSNLKSKLEKLSFEEYKEFLAFINNIPPNIDKKGLDTITQAYLNCLNKITREPDSIQDLKTIINNLNRLGEFDKNGFPDLIKIQNFFNKYKTEINPEAKIQRLFYDYQTISKDMIPNSAPISFLDFIEFKSIGFLKTKAKQFKAAFIEYQKTEPNITPSNFVAKIKEYNEYINSPNPENTWAENFISNLIKDKNSVLINDNNLLKSKDYLSGKILGEMLIFKNHPNSESLRKQIKNIRIIKDNIYLETNKEEKILIKDVIGVLNPLLTKQNLSENYYISVEKIKNEIQKHISILSTKNSNYNTPNINTERGKISFKQFYEENPRLIHETVKQMYHEHMNLKPTTHGMIRLIARNLEYSRITKADLEKYVKKEKSENIKNMLCGILLPLRDFEIGKILPNDEIITGFQIGRSLSDNNSAFIVNTKRFNKATNTQNTFSYIYNPDNSIRTMLRIDSLTKEEKKLHKSFKSFKNDRTININIE